MATAPERTSGLPPAYETIDELRAAFEAGAGVFTRSDVELLLAHIDFLEEGE